MSDIILTFNGLEPLDLLLYRRFKREVPGLVEQTFGQNPGLAALGEVPPRGTTVQVTLPAPPPKKTVRKVIKLYA